MKDNSLRMLQLILHPKQKIGVRKIHSELERDGYEVSIRNVQRNLITLSTMFSIKSDDAKPSGWSYIKDGKRPAVNISQEDALSAVMVEKYL